MSMPNIGSSVFRPASLAKPGEHAILSVMPKSGHMHMAIFFSAYKMLLENQEPRDDDLTYKGVDNHSFNKKMFMVAHLEAPINCAACDPTMLKIWAELKYTDRIPWNTKILKILPDLGSHLIDREQSELVTYRMVFVFRNVLDYIISLYKFMHSYPPDSKDDPKCKISLEDLEDFIFKQNALDAYLKMFYSWHLLRQEFPELVLFVSYEQLMRNRACTLQQIMQHLNIPYAENTFSRAMLLTSLENLKLVEHRYRPLLSNTEHDTTKHIRNGGVGVWQEHMSPQIVLRIEERFNQFGLSIGMFTLAENLDDRFSFLHETTPGVKTSTTIPTPKIKCT